MYTCDVQGHMIKIEALTADVIRTVFPAKKSTKRHKKHLVSVSTCYPMHLDGIPKKWLSSRRLLFKNNEGSVRSSVASQNAPSTLSTFLAHTYKRSVSFQSNKFWTPYSRMSERTYSLKKIVGGKKRGPESDIKIEWWRVDVSTVDLVQCSYKVMEMHHSNCQIRGDQRKCFNRFIAPPLNLPANLFIQNIRIPPPSQKKKRKTGKWTFLFFFFFLPFLYFNPSQKDNIN